MSTEIYTAEQWGADNTFKATAGQEITEEIYNRMLNALPPLSLPRDKARQALQDYKIAVHSGFLMGEMYDTTAEGEPLYMAFGMNDYGKGKHYYYLGLSIKQKELNGVYYFFDCLNAFLTDRYFELMAFESEKEAISTAANYEATLYKMTFEAGELTERKELYNPFGIFEG